MASRVIRKVRDMLDVDDAAIANGKTLVYRTASGKHEYEAAGGAADLSSAVILAPAASARNVIQPTLGSVIAAVVRAHAAQTVDIFRVEAPSGSGLGYVRVGASGAIGVGNGTYDPASYGGYTTGFVFSRADDGYWDSDGGPRYTPGADEYVCHYFADAVVEPTADGLAGSIDHYGLVSAFRMLGTKTAWRLVGAYQSAAFKGTKAAGSGAQLSFLLGTEVWSLTYDGSTGDVTDIIGTDSKTAHRGAGTVGSMVGVVGEARWYNPSVGSNALTGAMRGVDGLAHVLATSGAALPEIVGVRARAVTDGRAVTVAKGVDILNIGQHANVVTSYGLYMAAQSGATNVYGLYVAGGKSVFVDSLITGKIALPADADFANGQGAWWWDQANSLPKWKGKTSGGVVVNFVPADATALSDHLADAADAHDASAISFTPTGTVAATDVQAAIAEVASEAAGGGIPASTVDAKGDLIAATAADTVARLAVGSNDQVLTADSAQATGLKWAAAGGGISATIFDANTVLKADADDTPVALTMGASTILARLAAGNIKAASVAEIATLLGSYAFTTGIVYATGYIGSGFGGVVDRMDLTAFPPVYQATTFDRIGIYCNNASATAVVRLGIYNDVGGVPTTLVLDAGTVACSTTGEKTITISQLLPPGRYWLAAVPQVAVAASAYDLATRGNDFSSGGVGGVFYHAIKYGGMFTHSAAVSGALPASTASWVQDGGIRVAMRAA